VHKATLNNEELAVKIQYPGVADSITSDLNLVKPFALKMFNLNAKDSAKFFSEVENKLKEETDYSLELKRSIFISEECSLLPGLVFPQYFNDLSNEKIITMSWINGEHSKEFIQSNRFSDSSLRNSIGQSLWDFYMFQMHQLKMVHADPHPGNFIITPENKLAVIDFGCIKEIPEDFYKPYFDLTEQKYLDDKKTYLKNLYLLEILREEDTDEEKELLSSVFHELLSLFAKPFNSEVFDFSSENFFKQVADIGDKYTNDKQLRKVNANRGSKHLLYMNRTFFGLYNLLYELKAEIKPYNYKKFLK
jgi:predicted unusual protein kinase regulating ubiquinone biosynthesis (AarF/ABC1/UbiB family)